jgi:hypothetical protein
LDIPNSRENSRVGASRFGSRGGALDGIKANASNVAVTNTEIQKSKEELNQQ